MINDNKTGLFKPLFLNKSCLRHFHPFVEVGRCPFFSFFVNMLASNSCRRWPFQSLYQPRMASLHMIFHRNPHLSVLKNHPLLLKSASGHDQVRREVT